MARERNVKHTAHTAKERHRRDVRPIPRNSTQRAYRQQAQNLPLKALKDVQKFRYPSQFEWVENTEKKDRKIDLIPTASIQAPAGYVFVPVGAPRLTAECKESSRARAVPVYIVTMSLPSRLHSPQSPEDADESILDQIKDYKSQMTRLGYHFQVQVVQDGMSKMNVGDLSATFVGEAIRQDHFGHLIPELIPNDPRDVFEQADNVIRDLFPRIPNTDRTEVVMHAFNKSAPNFRGEKKVGLVPELPLSRRAALAVLAHIRHTHTRYDNLLKEAGYHTARKAVESVCLEFLVKWRGDEETGRDIAPEVLRELVVIDEDSDKDQDVDSSDDEGSTSSDTDQSSEAGSLSRQGLNAANASSPVMVNSSSPINVGSSPIMIGSSPMMTGSPTRPQAARMPLVQSPRLAHHTPIGGHVRKLSRNFYRYEQTSRQLENRALMTTGNHLIWKRDQAQGATAQLRRSPEHRMIREPVDVVRPREVEHVFQQQHGRVRDGQAMYPGAPREHPIPSHYLPDMLVPSVEPASPAHRAFDKTQLERRQHPAGNMDEDPYAQEYPAAYSRSQQAGLGRSDAAECHGLVETQNGHEYSFSQQLRPVNSLARDDRPHQPSGSWKSTLETMGFIEIHRHADSRDPFQDRDRHEGAYHHERAHHEGAHPPPRGNAFLSQPRQSSVSQSGHYSVLRGPNQLGGNQPVLMRRAPSFAQPVQTGRDGPGYMRSEDTDDREVGFHTQYRPD